MITPPKDSQGNDLHLKPEELRINIAKMKRLVNATHIPIPENEEIDVGELIGQELNVLLIVKTVDGVERNEVKDWLSI